ncbi:hypothetical protein POM88_028952 [Heracleum sosnowskyi]|uniref:Prolamin-like domain-containing protein n=1 Tax=Heracleum sosnowskyi TaxID=360622 RepID=A0AAD8HSR8_9APIA|nr:hypothetical protein POM88_028952 [Heracleum sosnowskyi]
MANSSSSLSNSMVFVAMLMFIFVSTTAEHNGALRYSIDGPRLLPETSTPPQNFDYIKECWLPLATINKCPDQIIEFLLNKNFNLSSECCKKFDATPDKCWKKMFPFHPEFPPLVKKYCRG